MITMERLARSQKPLLILLSSSRLNDYLSPSSLPRTMITLQHTRPILLLDPILNTRELYFNSKLRRIVSKISSESMFPQSLHPLDESTSDHPQTRSNMPSPSSSPFHSAPAPS